MLFNKFDRTSFLSKQENEMNSQEWDLLVSGWDKFKLTSPVKFNTVQRGDIGRPDYLSYRIYNSSKYWWILCKVNQIDDLWSDLYIGMNIVIPDLKDIEAFYASVRNAQRE